MWLSRLRLALRNKFAALCPGGGSSIRLLNTSTPMEFDLEKAKAKDSAVLHLKGANGECLYVEEAGKDPQPVTVTVYGPGSEQFQRAQLSAQRRVMALLKKGRNDRRSADERREDVAELLADLTVEFGNLQFRGLSGRALAVAVYSERQLGYIADQVNAFSADWANF